MDINLYNNFFTNLSILYRWKGHKYQWNNSSLNVKIRKFKLLLINLNSQKFLLKISGFEVDKQKLGPSKRYRLGGPYAPTTSLHRPMHCKVKKNNLHLNKKFKKKIVKLKKAVKKLIINYLH